MNSGDYLDAMDEGEDMVTKSRKQEPPKKLQLDPDDGLDEEKEATPEEAEKIREQKIARLTQVLDRGVLNDKLQQVLERCTPPGRVGKFVRYREEDVIRYNNLGYTFDVVEGSYGLHAAADGKVVIGDVVLMTISREDYEILQEIRRRGIKKKLGLGRQEYKNMVEQHGGAPIVDESHTIIG